MLFHPDWPIIRYLRSAATIMQAPHPFAETGHALRRAHLDEPTIVSDYCFRFMRGKLSLLLVLIPLVHSETSYFFPLQLTGLFVLAIGPMPKGLRTEL